MTSRCRSSTRPTRATTSTDDHPVLARPAFPSLHRYVAAQTPLFPLLEAYAGKLIGYALWRLRLVEVAISYVLALAVYYLLRRRLELERLAALSLALLFLLSRTSSARPSASSRTTSQRSSSSSRSSARALPPDPLHRCVPRWLRGARRSDADASERGLHARRRGLYALRAGSTLLRRAELAGAVALTVIPVGLLFLSWHGLVPPGGDPSSCALCGAGRDVGGHEGALVVQTRN